ncbi:hypothetical protein Tco_1578204 [Tanacetum coccineum]
MFSLVYIMPPRMRTPKCVARLCIPNHEEGNGLVEVGGETRPGENLLPSILAQVGNQGNVGNQNGNEVNENVQENVRNVLVNGNWVSCSYKEFLACNPKEYDGKGDPWDGGSNGAKDYTKVMQIFGALTDEAIRNGSIKKVKKRGNMEEPSMDMNGRDDNKRTMTENDFASTANLVGRENTGVWPKCTTCNSYHAPEGPCRTCFNCNHPGHLAKDYKRHA